jgi:ATP-dependent DNA helicase RecG
VSGAWIKIGFFVTDVDLRYQDEIHGNLFQQVEKTLELLHTKYLKAYIGYEGLHRRETFLFSYAALREALLNAVAHKDYASGIPIQISVYDDKLVIWNPGILPHDWTIKNLLGKHPSCPFNPLVANAVFRAGYIESWGRGIEKIRQECLAHGIQPPVYDSGMAGLMLTFHANPEHLAKAKETDGTTQETPGKNSVKNSVKTSVKTSVKILKILRQNPEMTLAEVATQVNRSVRAVELASSKLVREGKLKYEGPQKGGHWKVIP